MKPLKHVVTIGVVSLSACNGRSDQQSEKVNGVDDSTAQQVAQSAAVYLRNRRIADFQVDPATQYYLMTVQMSCDVRDEYTPVLFRVDTSIRNRRTPIANIPTLFWEVSNDGSHIRIESEPTLKHCYISAWQPVRDECREAQC